MENKPESGGNEINEGYEVLSSLNVGREQNFRLRHEVMNRLKDMKSELKNMKLDHDVNEIDRCFEDLTNLHDCKEQQFLLRYETMRKLKEEKNHVIESLGKELDEVKLENATLNFIVGTMDNPNVLNDVINENQRMKKEITELTSILRVRSMTIKQLQDKPIDLKHLWGSDRRQYKANQTPNTNPPSTTSDKPVVETLPEERHNDANQEATPSEDDENGVNDLQRLAHLKLSGRRREDPQSEPVLTKQIISSPKRFICNKCGQDHNSSEELEDHLDIHCEDGDYTCDTCLYQCNKIKLLKDHLLNSQGHSG